MKIHIASDRLDTKSQYEPLCSSSTYDGVAITKKKKKQFNINNFINFGGCYCETNNKIFVCYYFHARKHCTNVSLLIFDGFSNK